MIEDNTVTIYETGLEVPDSSGSGKIYENVQCSSNFSSVLAVYDKSACNYLIRYTYPADHLQPRKTEYWDDVTNDFVKR